MEVMAAKPAYVVFERQAIEDREATLKQGRYMTMDVDFAIVTPVGSRDRIPRKVDEWFVVLDQYVKEGRMPAAWAQHYKDSYATWKKGEELPLAGTAIKGWQLLSPSEQANVISANILTVEDLANANDEAKQRMGMGALALCDRAKAWLKTAKDVGTTAMENAAMKKKMETLEAQNKDLLTRLANLEAAQKAKV